jgi:hypothetical protein
MPAVRSLRLTAPLLALVGLSAGCKSIAGVRAGPAISAHEETPYGGAEADVDVHLDLGEGADWSSEAKAEELALRYGPMGGGYVRGTGLGFGTGGRAGFSLGGTSTDILVLGSGAAQTGMQTLGGTAYFAVGAIGVFNFGIAVDEPEGDALARCRSTTYLTFGAQGGFDYLTAPETFIPTAGLTIGIMGLDDREAAPAPGKAGDDCP